MRFQTTFVSQRSSENQIHHHTERPEPITYNHQAVYEKRNTSHGKNEF
ncbi:hypothetical protein NEIMUCOT_04350 [Neisseria mucosa ATCC 25996]|uniref:Uncharacterized protein n=1 Tax=Neisseria mucosa (strain ATCC 25996 / DSM 4631 / NCTC 10774 / M26) TaxID=546266 RepID=D2ZUR0_NEIM2|nr:hypothetical protein NEIMUCOT_04350 [Neisseria mucosa ATCC 25996]